MHEDEVAEDKDETARRAEPWDQRGPHRAPRPSAAEERAALCPEGLLPHSPLRAPRSASCPAACRGVLPHPAPTLGVWKVSRERAEQLANRGGS